MTDNLTLYTVSDSYIEFLHAHADKHIFANKGDQYVHTRKYLGVVLTINFFRYYVPLSSPKQTDYIIKDGQRSIRKSIIPIIRMIDVSADGRRTLLGTLKFNSMIPVPDTELIKYDVAGEPDHKYRDLIEKELRFINRHTTEIRRNASIIYKQKTSGLTGIGYLNSTLDFTSLEQLYKQFEIITKSEKILDFAK